MFLTLKNGALAFWPRFSHCVAALIEATWLVITQAWTLGLEFSFYLIVRGVRCAAILLAFATSLGLIYALAIACLGTALIINGWHGLSRVASVFFWMAAVGAIPFLFRMTKSKVADHYLGELFHIRSIFRIFW